MDDVTVVIATFNSERTLPLTLESIAKQNYPKELVHILVIDGGSSDSTLEIAFKYNCTIINNPLVGPAHAKHLGLINTHSKYLVYLDHDEVFTNFDSIQKKINVFNEYTNVKIVIGSGYKTPASTPSINYYLNEFGDPFSFYIYRLSKDYRYFLNKMKKLYPVTVNNIDCTVFNFKGVRKWPIIEHGAAGSMVNKEHYMHEFNKVKRSLQEAYHFQSVYFYYLMGTENSFLAISHNDVLLHYSAENIKSYLAKIKWRIMNNIFHRKSMGITGYLSRESFNSANISLIKKYFFIPYSILLLPCFFDSVYLSVTRRNFSYLIHTPLCIYTSSLIIIYSIKNMMGITEVMTSYDGKKKLH
jgi:glycosyltransferase involved in cell wall biosynthesis